MQVKLATGTRPVLRPTAPSTDCTWWHVHGIRKPLGIRYTLGGTVRAVCTRSWRNMQIDAPARAREGIVQILRAPGTAPGAESPLGGQSFAYRTTTGRLAGTGTQGREKASGQRFSVTVPPASAAVAAFPRSS
jgi:hypothetical protein